MIMGVVTDSLREVHMKKECIFYNLKQICFLAVLYVTKYINSNVIKLTAIVTVAKPGLLMWMSHFSCCILVKNTHKLTILPCKS